MCPASPSDSHLAHLAQLGERLLAACAEAGDPIRALAAEMAQTAASLRDEPATEGAYYRALMENAYDSISVIGPDGVIRDQNAALLRTLGYTEEERLGRNAFDFMHPADRASVQAELAELLREPGGVRTVEFRTRHADGSWRVVESTATNLLHNPGVGGIVVNSRDITERRAAEEALRASEGRFRLLVEAIHDYAVMMLDPDGFMVSWNRGAERTHGYRSEEVIGRHFSAFYPPGAREQAADALARARDEGTSEQEGWRIRGDGSRFWANSTISAMRSPEGRLVGFSKVTRDLTSRREAEEALRQSEERFRTVFHHAVIGISLSDPMGRTLEANPALQAIVGYSLKELREKGWGDLTHPDDAELSAARFHAMMRGEIPGYELEKRYVHRDGHVVWAQLVAYLIRAPAGEPRYVVCMVEDTTERRRAEEHLRVREAELRQALKMEAVGRLAGGVAHDFNNILMAVGGHTKLLLRKTAEGDPAYWSLTEIQKGAQRAAELTRHLLAFSRKQVLQPRLLLLGDIILGMKGMLDRLIGADVELVLRPSDGTTRVLADPTQMEQVVLNLVVNARDAMPLGGVIVVESDDLEIGPDDVEGRPGLPPGRYAALCVTDSGSGIDPEVLPRIFDPFFTTKPADQGTGLGLSTVYGIAKQSGGYVYARSTPGKATTFELFLPPAAGPAPAEPGPAAARAAPRGGSETVLLVEDDSGVRMLAHAVLGQAGYHVLAAADGPAALALAASYAGTIHLVLTDMVMPGMSGSEVARRLAESRPGTRVLYMSGYTEDRAVIAGLGPHSKHFVTKPIDPDALSRVVRDTLDRPAEPTV